jgi:thiazole tautomerase (transcriptional regulator TenI)
MPAKGSGSFGYIELICLRLAAYLSSTTFLRKVVFLRAVMVVLKLLFETVRSREMSKGLSQLHIISTGAEPLESFCDKAIMLAPYVTAFHLRERKATALELLQACRQLIDGGVPKHKIIINDRVDVAAVAGVRGVQLAWHSLPVHSVKQTFSQLTVGKSVHSCDEAALAEQEGCDYVLCGHIYATFSKPNLPPRGVDILRDIVDQVHIPVIAIGGIQPQHVSAIAETGAAGIAVMSGILNAPNMIDSARDYVGAMQATRQF